MYETFYYWKFPFLEGLRSEWYFWAPIFHKAIDLLMHTKSVVVKDCTRYWTWLWINPSTWSCEVFHCTKHLLPHLLDQDSLGPVQLKMKCQHYSPCNTIFILPVLFQLFVSFCNVCNSLNQAVVFTISVLFYTLHFIIHVQIVMILERWYYARRCECDKPLLAVWKLTFSCVLVPSQDGLSTRCTMDR